MNFNINAVRKQLAYKPFRPFWLETSAGFRFLVEKAEWFHEVPESFGRLVISDSGGVVITRWDDLTETIEIEDPQQA